MNDPVSKEMMLEIARDYDRIAQKAEDYGRGPPQPK
jgi:hypothetical protein